MLLILLLLIFIGQQTCKAGKLFDSTSKLYFFRNYLKF
jgi:hypothetical protein